MSSDPRRLPGLLRRVLASRRGISAIEFGLTLPVIAVILLGTYDLGNLVQQTTKLEEALHAGGQYAISFPGDTAGMTATITAALPPGWTDVTIATPTLSCACGTLGGEASADCNAAPLCPLGEIAERFITFSATKPYSALLLTSFLTSISASHVARVQ